MVLCANCYQELKEGEPIVTSVIDGTPMHEECANVCPTCHGYLTDQQMMDGTCICSTQDKHKRDNSAKSTLEVVRRSHIETYKKCPYCFYLETVKGYTGDNNPAAIQGIVLHDIFDHYSSLPIDTLATLEDDMIQEFEKRFREDYQPDEKDMLGLAKQQDLLKNGYQCIKQFIEWQHIIGNPYESEINLQYALDDNLPKVSMTFDRINREPSGYVLMDYKCGATFTGKKLEEDLQVPLYCEGARQHYGEYPVKFSFLFMREGKTRDYIHQGNGIYHCVVRKKTYEINVPKRLEDVKVLLSDIQSAKFSQLSTNHFWCSNFCNMKRGGYCNGQTGYIPRG